MPEPRAEIVTDSAALQALRGPWERLWRALPDATPFQSPHWLLPWWRHVGCGRLASVALWSGDELLGLAPLYVYTDPATGRRQLFPLGVATTDRVDLLVKPGWEEGLWSAVLAVPGWDVLELWPVRPTARWLPGAWERLPAEANPVLALGPGAALPCGEAAARPATRRAIPARMAQNLRTARSRASRAGRLHFDRAGPQDLPGFLDALLRLHGQRWAARGLPGVLADEAVLAWHREALPQLQEAGLLRLHALLLDGRFIAVLYGLADPPWVAGRRCYHYIGGFDPAQADLSPGTLLIGHCIAEAAAEGAVAFDFLRGAEPYKYRWGARDEPMARLQLDRARGLPA